MLSPIHLYLVRNIQISPLHALNSPMQTALPPSSPISRPPLLHIPILILMPELRHLRPPPKLASTTSLSAVNASNTPSSLAVNILGTIFHLKIINVIISTGNPIVAIVWEIATVDSTPRPCQTLPEEVKADPRGTYGEERAARLDEAGSRSRQTSRCSMSFVSMEPQPTTKKTPTKMERGMMDRTTRRGPVIVPMMVRPMKK
jgi:hypothetical protein